MSESPATPEPGAPLLGPAEEEQTGQIVSHAETIRRLGDELAETRKALAEAEQRLLALRDQRSRTMGRLERQAYWLERANVDLDEWMRSRTLRLALRTLQLVLRLRRRLLRRRQG